MFGRRFCIITVLIVILSSVVYAGKSVFIISSHDSYLAEAFRIDGNSISFQDMIDISTYNPGVGPVGIATWPEKNLLFVTFENSNVVVWSSTKTLEKVGYYDTPIPDCSGIVVDPSRELIYIMWRDHPDLYVYSFDEDNNTLTSEGSHQLQTDSGYINGWGLALDEENDLLYVTDNSNRVHYYDANNFDLQGYIDITVGSNDRAAVGIAVDPNRGYLYTGNFSGSWGSHNYLVRTSLASPYTSIETDIGGPVIGIDVDKSTGLVYCTTHTSYGQYTSDFRVYDSGLTLLDIERNDGIESPAGVAVGGLYKPPLFYLEKVDVNEPNCVISNGYITYRIAYGPNGVDHNNVVLTDYLPYGVDYENILDPNYDFEKHTYTWEIGDLDANDPCDSVMLIVKVNDCILGCGTITNYCEAESDFSCSTAEASTPVCSASSPNPACGEIVGLDVGEFNLTWCPGLFAADVNGHEVYFGSNFDDVNDANSSDPNVYKETVTDPCYTIDFNSLDVDTTYYWRIDEVNANHPAERWRGGVWSFTTDNYRVVENFDSYESRDALTDVWEDYWENGSRAFLQLVKTGEPGQRPVRDGSSVEYSFANNKPPHYSVAEAALADLPSDIGSDWSTYEELSLWFYGQEDNPVNSQMYVSLTDGDSPSKTATVPYGDMNDIKVEEWQEWNIDLQEFLDDNDDVNLANVATITIGFGDGSSSDPGIVYFEDIRLYLRSCFPGYDPVGDFDLDCDVDFSDFAVFSLAWLISSEQRGYNPICDISEPKDGTIDEHDLARFCDDWLWQRGRAMSMGSGFGGTLYAAAPLEQRQLALESEPQLQFQPLTKADIEELADWLEELWLTDEELRKTMDEDEWQEFIEAVR